MSAIFRNKFQTRIAIDDHIDKREAVHIVLGVYTPTSMMPVIFGIPMRYEMGQVNINRVTSHIVPGDEFEMHFTTEVLDTLSEVDVKVLASGGHIVSEAATIQLLRQ